MNVDGDAEKWRVDMSCGGRRLRSSTHQERNNSGLASYSMHCLGEPVGAISKLDSVYISSTLFARGVLQHIGDW